MAARRQLTAVISYGTQPQRASRPGPGQRKGEAAYPAPGSLAAAEPDLSRRPPTGQPPQAASRPPGPRADATLAGQADAGQDHLLTGTDTAPAPSRGSGARPPKPARRFVHRRDTQRPEIGDMNQLLVGSQVIEGERVATPVAAGQSATSRRTTGSIWPTPGQPGSSTATCATSVRLAA